MLSENILEISSLNEWDRLKLDCAIVSQYNDHYNCYKCIKTFPEPHKARKFQETKGCFSKQKRPVCSLDNGTKLYMCPGRMFTQNEIDLISDYRMMEKTGEFPLPGGIYFQNSRTIEAFKFIEIEIIKNENIRNEEQRKKMEREAKMKGRK